MFWKLIKKNAIVFRRLGIHIQTFMEFLKLKSVNELPSSSVGLRKSA